MTTDGRWGRRALSAAALVAAFAVAMVVLSPSRPGPEGAAAPTRLSPAEEYAQAALQLMQERALLVDEATWPGVVRKTMAAVHTARSPAQTYPALGTALAQAAGPAGMLIPPEDAHAPEVAEPVDVRTSGGVGRVTVPAIGEMRTNDASARAAAVADRVGMARNRTTCGWLVDLRDTASQTDWGAIAGLEPLLRPGWVFGFRDRNDREYRVSVAMGSVFVDGRPLATSGRSGTRNERPVAVLQSARTAGAGEALALAFKQEDQHRVRTFGEDTSGQPLLESFPLSDGARLVLPTHRLVDVAGHTYPKGVPPTVRTDAPERMALDWLHQQCR
ncbi:MAG: S41 family peptidase [Intrasporangium sp.]|uniref:S41 family peptidase n=1 Tax=Intrasporangium sp. TaxID=1925024 RepID=UPI00264961C8|nr:S41 family peptidase [Intrasporangium sp.]MDN5795364.1 S41 family peptidase [Intrasporangium sp.]